MVFENWQQVITSLGDEKNHFFTKEDYELIRSYISVRNFNFEEKMRDFLENLPFCQIYQILKIRKIGNQLLEDRRLRLEAINRSQEAYIDWCKSQIDGLCRISETFSAVPTVDVKQAVLSLIIETQIVTQITRLGSQTELLEAELLRNPFCVDCCEVE